jgi:hypothetical protein
VRGLRKELARLAKEREGGRARLLESADGMERLVGQLKELQDAARAAAK